MQGLEVVVLRLAGTLAVTVVKSLIATRPGAGLVTGRRAAPLPRPDPAPVARKLAGRLSDPYADLPDHEREAAVEAVRDTVQTAGTVTPDRLFALDLDPERLFRTLRDPAAGLAERGVELYDELLRLCCAHMVEKLTADQSFMARAAVEQTRRAGRTEALVEDVRDRLGPRPEALALSFEERYADYVAETHGRLELFGLTLGRSGSEWPLDTAYISLAVSGDGPHQEGFGLPRTGQVAVKAEQILSSADRLVLRGPAGSGKSTLVQWLALNAARRSFGKDLEDWNRCVPFLLRLRAFTSSDTLPMPDAFLRAAGVPLHGEAPAGWTEKLLTDGRALILVDGVDEIPSRQRLRTENWLKSLIAAYPDARYVVTTRPSAVPEDWLSRQGFVGHSLLPMERDDIRSFIGHWHEAARQECLAPAERAQLDTYETSLRKAVSTRRDLGRLATNPLMCALLCALNRDRRMQLPRARKELYDAALDMLLVRRDTEREIVGVEGVDLTREEQTALLQRLAYWLIRNGQVEAERAEAVEMVAEWLAAMPQVQGSPEQVFSHLLIRSGLLREPRPGAVDFVHRTFQDYLGAKAAVEARDFGVLVQNAHDDQWDDVVQMAVGHARVEERARLLRQLLRRADRAQRHRHRLVLLAAACLEHAPELDPEIRATVQSRTQELLPPRTQEDAAQLAKVGELVLELLPGPEDLEEYTAAAVVRTAALIKGDAAFEVAARFREDARLSVAFQVSTAWGSFDTESYARDVLAAGAWDTSYLHVQTPEQLHALRHIPKARRLHVAGDHHDLTPLLAVEDPEWLFLYENGVVDDLTPLASFRRLTEVGLSRCPELRDLRPLARPGLEHLALWEVHPEVSIEPLRDMPDLRSVMLSQPLLIENLAELPVGPRLVHLGLHHQTRYVSLEGIERWPLLETLSIAGQSQLRQLSRLPLPPTLTSLSLYELDPLDPRPLLGHSTLRRLYLWRCELPHGLGLLRDLPALTSLELSQCSPSGAPVDVAPLAAMPGLRITVTDDTPVVGLDRFPPDRVEVKRVRT
ncbi:NACHT domain-containing protein [Streptomyces pristinaespiralis]|uniref:NACHT domain-containing protein n=1 Tax=Streptomyces pristinaespiralis TaxID=38300 RepID=UPI0033EF7666